MELFVSKEKVINNLQIKSFVKKYTNEEIFFESLKNSQEAYTISQKTVTFATPSVLNYDGEKCLISFEFLENAKTVRKLLRSCNYLSMPKKQIKSLFYNIGASLAEYHIHSKKLHGDFQPNNVMFKPDRTNKIYFVDFSRSELCDNDPKYNHGSIYKDLALFAVHIKIKYPFYLFPLVLRKFNDVLCEKLFKGYVEYSKTTFDHDKLISEVENYRQKFYKDTFVFKFFNWSQITKIKGYKNGSKSR